MIDLALGWDDKHIPSPAACVVFATPEVRLNRHWRNQTIAEVTTRGCRESFDAGWNRLCIQTQPGISFPQWGQR